MINNIAFVGGIHGVGKSTICREICDELKLEYLSASELIKWEVINEDIGNKKIQDISETQNRLIIGLKIINQESNYYILDGHYCLINKENDIVNVPIETFKFMNLFSLNIILGDTTEIKSRLEKRDNLPYSKEFLNEMQERELEYARYLSKTLGLPLNIGFQNDYSNLLTNFRVYIRSKL